MTAPGTKSSNVELPKTSAKKASLKESFTVFKEPIFYVCLLSNILFQYGFDAFMTTLVSFDAERSSYIFYSLSIGHGVPT